AVCRPPERRITATAATRARITPIQSTARRPDEPGGAGEWPVGLSIAGSRSTVVEGCSIMGRSLAPCAIEKELEHPADKLAAEAAPFCFGAMLVAQEKGKDGPAEHLRGGGRIRKRDLAFRDALLQEALHAKPWSLLEERNQLLERFALPERLHDDHA